VADRRGGSRQDRVGSVRQPDRCHDAGVSCTPPRRSPDRVPRSRIATLLQSGRPHLPSCRTSPAVARK
jgi:hypothetical protein